VPLLGWQFETLLAGLMVLVMVITLVLWPRVLGPQVLRAAQRLGMVLVCQVTAVLVVAAALNNYGYFYGTWSDLFGTNTQKATVTGVSWPQGHFGKAGAVAAVSFVRPTEWSTPAQFATRGKVETVHITGTHTGLQMDTLVYLPPEYFQAAYAHRAFPAVEVLTGYPGIITSLVAHLHVPDLLLGEVQHHRAHPMVVVMLRPTVAPPRDTECTDVPDGPQAMTFLSQDVPSAIDGLLRVRPVDWGAMGDSTGGYCAVKIAMTHSDVFRSAVSMSGYYRTLEDPTTGDLWGHSRVLRNLNDPEWLLANQSPPPISVLTSIGLYEGGLTGLADTRKFLSLVRPPMSASSVFVPGGGHNYTSWAKIVPTAMDWLSAKLHA
jgi:enterochelin esterase-like enzyme